MQIISGLVNNYRMLYIRALLIQDKVSADKYLSLLHVLHPASYAEAKKLSIKPNNLK
jgi:hypothetical protein